MTAPFILLTFKPPTEMKPLVAAMRRHACRKGLFLEFEAVGYEMTITGPPEDLLAFAAASIGMGVNFRTISKNDMN